MKKTNYERIKNMSIKEMSRFIFWLKNNACDKCYCAKGEQCICYEDDEVCFCGIEKWLNSEVNDG